MSLTFEASDELGVEAFNAWLSALTLDQIVNLDNRFTQESIRAYADRDSAVQTEQRLRKEFQASLLEAIELAQPLNVYDKLPMSAKKGHIPFELETKLADKAVEAVRLGAEHKAAVEAWEAAVDAAQRYGVLGSYISNARDTERQRFLDSLTN